MIFAPHPPVGAFLLAPGAGSIPSCSWLPTFFGDIMKKVWREVVGDDAGRKEVFAALRDMVKVDVFSERKGGEWLRVYVLYDCLHAGDAFVGTEEQPRKFRIEVKPPEAGDGYRLLDDELMMEEDEFYIQATDTWKRTHFTMDLDGQAKKQDNGLFYRRKVEPDPDYVDVVPYEYSWRYYIDVAEGEYARSMELQMAVSHFRFLGYVWGENERELVTVHPVAYRGVDGRLWPNDFGDRKKEVCKAVRFAKDKS
jgi:hypothetical protein